MHNDHFINIQKPENENKTAPVASAQKPITLSRAEQLDAITWAANKAGKSYGRFSSRLTTEEKNEIYHAYREWQKERAAEFHERMQERKKKTFQQEASDEDDDLFETEIEDDWDDGIPRITEIGGQDVSADPE